VYKKLIKVVYDYGRIRNLCTEPYPNHPHGCPNYGMRDCCPPRAPWFYRHFRFDKPVYLIWSKYEFGKHVDRMRAKHPDWSYRQLSCCLYWQGTARKVHRGDVAAFEAAHPEYEVTSCPEAMGVDITKSMWQVGEDLEWPPRVWTYQVSIAGIRRHLREQE